ncbi:prohibitin family protein [Geothrix sp. PMB-07]|uniref:prohibitin family protein n=1 Tax=Geothrix sp. PMB-07 TaxID=3068640 RepID=UPI0027404557|nr:prohibitin family protein [Geothrix sp. PMB-07]WLT31825.1 prohibitin family protein [Geothrix sp. PMB-07]
MILLAVLLLVVGVLAWRWKTKVGFPLSARLAIVQWVGLGLGVLVLLASMAVVVPPGQAGIQVLFGKVNSEPLPSGLHFINPFSQVVEMEVRTRNYTMSNVADEGQRKGDDSIAVISSDGLTVKLDATIFYSLQQARLPEIYRTIGPDVEERIVRSEIRASLRDAAAALSATELYTSKRQSFVDQVTKTLKAAFEARGINLEQMLLRNVILPDQITKAINDKISADQDAQKMAFVLQKEKQEAERKRIEAEGQARAQQIVSQSLTPQIIEYQRIQALRDIGAKGNLIITPMGGATPMIQVSAKK